MNLSKRGCGPHSDFLAHQNKFINKIYTRANELIEDKNMPPQKAFAQAKKELEGV